MATASSVHRILAHTRTDRMLDHMLVILKQPWWGFLTRSVEARQGLMMTLVPTGTRGYSSWESEMYIRMHP